MENFAHLHVHTEYSLLDGLSKIDELVKTVKEMGMKAIAVTDHGSCSGHKDLEVACEKYEIKPIYGCEFYMSMSETPCKEDYNYHLVVLAQNEEGLQNLYQMYNESFDKFYYKPHITFNLLKKYKKGLIITSACLGGVIPNLILKNDIKEVKEWINKFKNEFGDNFYLEVQPNDIPDQFQVNNTIFKLAEEMNVKVVACNDVHYTFKSDTEVHEVLLALQSKKKWEDPKRFKFTSNDFWLKSFIEMKDTSNCSIDNKGKFIQAILNTNEIVDKCDYVKLPKGNFMPHYNKLEPNETEKEALAKLSYEGINKKYPTKRNVPIIDEVNHELDVIDGEGYSGYFLIVADYIKEARKAGVLVGDGRGSGAGSKVAYLTDITRVDPIKHNLIFERFMDKGRQPDIDVDVSDQDWVFKYFQSQYGERNVARIITYGTLTAKSCTRKVLGCFGFSMSEIAKVIGYMPNRLSFTFEEALNESKNLNEFMEKHHFIKQCITRLEGKISHEGKHAGGIVIYPNISKYLPLKMETDEKGIRNTPVAMLTKYPLEEAGFVKLDVLGLETLPIIKHTLDLIEEPITLPNDENSELNDKKVYEMLRKGEVLGIFQLNGQAGRLVEQKPKKFSDLVAFTSIIRPGTGDYQEYIARREGKEWYIAPERQIYMKESEGLMIYQEQYLQDAKTYANWSYGFSDKYIRKNKKLKEDKDLEAKFVEHSIANGYKEDIVRNTWREIVEVAGGGYGFNKSHATCYSVITYQTAWLKCYYPTYFYSALLSAKLNDQEEVAAIISECKRNDIKILPPDLNKSTNEFIPTKEGIRIPLNYLKGVGEGVIPEIIHLRPIESLSDVFERRTKAIIRKNVLQALIKAGCFDFEDTRDNMMWKLDMLLRTKTQIKNNYVCQGYSSDEKMLLKWEREALGMYLNKHPLQNHNQKAIWEYEEGGEAIIVAELLDISKRCQKDGKEMAFLTLETPYGIHKGLVFGSIWANEDIQKVAIIGNTLYINGRRSANDILINEMEVLELA